MRDITWKKLFKKIGFLYLCAFVVFGAMFFLLRANFSNKFSEDKMNKTMTNVSSLRDITGDPCKYSILGDPMAAGEKYAKVNIICPDETHSNNSIDLQVLDQGRVIDLLSEVGRVNGFKVEHQDGLIQLGELRNIGGNNVWSCFVGTRKISDFEETVQNSSTVDCFYGDRTNKKVN